MPIAASVFCDLAFPPAFPYRLPFRPPSARTDVVRQSPSPCPMDPQPGEGFEDGGLRGRAAEFGLRKILRGSVLGGAPDERSVDIGVVEAPRRLRLWVRIWPPE